MPERSVPAIMAPPIRRDNPLTRSLAGIAGLLVLACVVLACVATLPWTLRAGDGGAVPRYNAGRSDAARLPPAWIEPNTDQAQRLNALVPEPELAAIAAKRGINPDLAREQTEGEAARDIRTHWPRWALGSDALGRSLLVRLLAGGGVSLAVGFAAACISVVIGTLYGSVAAYAGGRTDAFLMRIVDVLYGLPYILLVVLLAVAGDAMVARLQRTWAASTARARAAYVERGLAAATAAADRHDARAGLEQAALARYGTGELSESRRTLIDVGTLLVAIGGVSWLTMARVVRGQVLSLKSMPFVEAARAIGASPTRILSRHVLPNLVGPIVVYATLTVPQAILQESFLSFLGIGIKPPLPSWGNLAAEGLSELNPYESNWWLLLFPCLALGVTLLALNFVGEGLREAFDPRRART